MGLLFVESDLVDHREVRILVGEGGGEWKYPAIEGQQEATASNC